MTGGVIPSAVEGSALTVIPSAVEGSAPRPTDQPTNQLAIRPTNSQKGAGSPAPFCVCSTHASGRDADLQRRREVDRDRAAIGDAAFVVGGRRGRARTRRRTRRGADDGRLGVLAEDLAGDRADG